MNRHTKRPWILMGISGLIAVLPILSMLIADLIARINGCVLHEGFRNPCIIGGRDWGDTLVFMFTAAWYIFLTFPGGALGMLISLIWLQTQHRKTHEEVVQ